MGWGWALLLLAIQYLILLGMGRLNSGTGMPALHLAMEAQMLAWDGWREDEERVPAWLLQVMETEEIPRMLRAWMKESSRRGRTDNSLQTDWAVICHRFSQHENREAWLREGLESLEEVPTGEDSGIYGIAALKALDETPLTGIERTKFEDLQAKYPRDWFVAHLARVHGFPQDADSPFFEAKHGARLGAMVVVSFAAILLMLLALPCALLTWWILRKRSGGSRPSARRLFRLWPVSTVLGTWSLYEIARLGGGSIIAFVGALLIMLLLARSWEAYKAAMWFGYAVNVVSLAVVPVLMRFRFTRRRRILKRSFGLTAADFFSGRSVTLAVVGAVGILGGLTLMERPLKFAGLTPDILDYLSRNLSMLGDGAIPATLLWGCVLAPVVEEIAFRGFLFTSMREQWGAPAAAVVSSIIFAAMHAYGWLGTLHVFIYGIAFCTIFHHTGRLAPGIMMHGMVNVSILALSRLSVGV